MRRIAAVTATGALAIGALAMPRVGAEPERRTVRGPGFAYVQLAEGGASASGSTQAAARFVPPPNEDFVFHYEPDVSASKRAAFEAAGGIWSDVLEVAVPVHVAVSVESFSDPGILGGAAPTDLVANDPAFPATGVWYVSAMSNQLLGRDADPRRVEIDVLISADYEFHEEVGGPVPSDRVSLLTLALHELGHGLGHTSLAQKLPDRTGTVRHEGLPLAFDLHVRDRNRVPLVELDPAAVGAALTQGLTWSGSEGIKAEGGLLPELFAPRLFQPGSSVSHLDEGSYQTALMSPYIGNGELHTSVPPLTRAMMADFGWGLEARSRAETFVTAASRDFLRRFPSPTEMSFLAGLLDAGTTHGDMAEAFGYTDESLATVADRYHRLALRRPATAAERSRVARELRAGTPTAAVLARLLSSNERSTLTGGTTEGWVGALYEDVLGRQADRAGTAAWVDFTSRTSRAEAALRFVQSDEARALRVRELYRRLLGRDPDAAGSAAWSDILLSGQDLEAEIRMASSAEYVDRAFRLFG